MSSEFVAAFDEMADAIHANARTQDLGGGMAVDERELGSTERGFLLYRLLSRGPMKPKKIAIELGYASEAGACNLLYRMRAAQLVRDDNGYWYLIDD